MATSPAGRLEGWAKKSPVTHLAYQVLTALAEALAVIPTYLYMIWFTLSIPVRVFVGSATLALFIAACWFLIETVATAIHTHIVSLAVPAWLILLLALLLLRHHFHQIRSLSRKPRFIRNVNLLLREVAALTFSDEDERSREELKKFIANVLQSFAVVFKDIRERQLNVMLADSNERLQMFCIHPPDTRYDKTFIPSPGEGGAGVAYQEQAIVYIPAIRYRHGIIVKMPKPEQPDPVTYTLARSIYVPAQIETYKSILSVPISTATGITGVLNVNANRRNPFTTFDFETAEVAAAFVGMALDRHRARG